MLRNIFGFLGFISTSVYYILSAKTFLQLYKYTNYNLERVNFYKILFNYMISFFSYYYADFAYFPIMIICNKFGIFFCLILLLIYIYFEFKTDITNAIINLLLISITSITFSHYFYYILVDEDIYGFYFLLGNLIPLLYFLYEIYSEYKNKTNMNFSFYLYIIYTFSAFFWFNYGVLSNDFYIKITFGIETFIGILIFITNYFFGNICFELRGFIKINSEIINNNKNTIEFEEDKEKINENI